MLNIKTLASRLALAAVLATGLAAAAQAGTITVAPGATAKLDVGDRYGYTSITVVNASSSAGSLQLPAGSSAMTVPAGGKIELYDRYGRGASGAAYVSVTNSGSVPLTLTSRYQTSYPAP